MTRTEWTAIAEALAKLSEQLEQHARRGRPRAHRERLIGVKLAARTICHMLRQRSPRFDARRFMRIVGAPTK